MADLSVPRITRPSGSVPRTGRSAEPFREPTAARSGRKVARPSAQPWQEDNAPTSEGERTVHLPLLREHDVSEFAYRLNGPNCVLRWSHVPSSFSGALDVVVHLHGYAPHNRLNLRRKAQISGLDFDQPGVSRATLGLVPHGRAFLSKTQEDTDGFDFPALDSRASLRRFIDAGVAALARLLGTGSLTVGRVTLTGHSGGGATLTRLVQSYGASSAIDGFHYLDATYGGDAILTRAGGWLDAALERDVRLLGQTQPAQWNQLLRSRCGNLRIVYVEKTPTAGAALRVDAFIERRLNELSNDQSLKSALRKNYRALFIAKGGSVQHGTVAQAVGGKLIADPAHDLDGIAATPGGVSSAPRSVRGGARRAPTEFIEQRELDEALAGSAFADFIEAVDTSQSWPLEQSEHEQSEQDQQQSEPEPSDLDTQSELHESQTEYALDAGFESDAELYGSDWDGRLTQTLQAFFTEFSSVPVRIDTTTLNVHPPYFMNVSDPQRARPVTLARYERARQSRSDAPAALRALIAEARFRCARVGKGTAQELSDFLQASVDQRLLASPATADACRNFLIRYGMGIDCSGFVAQALNRLIALFSAAAASDRIADVCNTPSAALKGDSSAFRRVTEALDLCVGDTMWLPGHIRILSEVRVSENALLFRTLESRAGSGSVQSPGNEGPTRALWRLTADGGGAAGNFRGFRLERAANADSATPTWSVVSTPHTYSRYLPLARLLEQQGVRSVPARLNAATARPAEARGSGRFEVDLAETQLDVTPLTQHNIERLAAVSFANSQQIDAFFARRGAAGFIRWYNAELAGNEPFTRSGRALRMDTSAPVLQHFTSFWNCISSAYDRPQITLLEFATLMCIVLNETGGDFHANPERCGPGRSDARGAHPGLAYAFDRIENVKQSYNTLPGNRRAGELFNDPEYIQAHRALAGSAQLANQGASANGVWNSEQYPQAQFSTAEDVAQNGFILQADFYKFRGRGVIQTTSRSAYLRVIAYLQAYTGQDRLLLDYNSRWRNLSADVVATRSSNEDWDRIFTTSEVLARGLALHSGTSNDYRFMQPRAEILNHVPEPAGNPRGTAGSIYAMGRRISGRHRYGAGIYRDRVCALLNQALGLL